MSLIDRIEELLAQFVPQIRDAFNAAISDVVDNVVLKQVVDALERNDLSAAWRALGYSDAVFNPLVMSLQSMFQAGGTLIMGTFPKRVTSALDGITAALRFNVRDPRAESWLQDQSSTLITAIEDGMRNAVRNTLQAGMNEGRNPRNIALDIVGRIDPATGKRVGGSIGLGQREEYWSRNARQRLLTLDAGYFDMELRDKRFDETVRKAIKRGDKLPVDIVDKLVDRYRANALRFRGEQIGRTEALHSLNRSEWIATKQAVETGDLSANAVTREWDSAGDTHVRPSHVKLDGQRVGLDEPFISPMTGARMMHPGDTSLGAGGGEVIGCRCRVKTIVDWFAGVT